MFSRAPTPVLAFRRAPLVLPLLGAVLAAACLTLAAACLTGAPALANSGPEGPEYSLSIVEGESTQPEYGIAHTSAWAHPASSIGLSIVRGGITVARDTGHEGAWLSQVPQVGDVVDVEAPIGTLVGSVVYDGLPSIDPTVCAGSVNFSGQRSAGQTVTGATTRWPSSPTTTGTPASTKRPPGRPR
jgi:hypothetical protein